LTNQVLSAKYTYTQSVAESLTILNHASHKKWQTNKVGASESMPFPSHSITDASSNDVKVGCRRRQTNY